MSTVQEVEARLTGPGGPFEIVREEVLGETMPVLASRKRSLRELFEASGAFGDSDYIVCEGRRIGYAETVRLVASLAKVLRERYDVQKGDRVAILAANGPEWILAFWATVVSGGVVAALNGWWTRDEILYGIENSDPKLLIGDQRRLARLEGASLAIPVVEMERDLEALLAAGEGAVLPEIPIAEDDPAVILFTSGTTGRPKGAVNTHRGICGFVSLNLFNGVRHMMLAAARGKAGGPPANQPCALVTAPLFHLSGLYTGVVMMLSVGARTVYRRGRFDPVDCMKLIEREKVTTWAVLGTMGHQVVDHPDVGSYDLSSVTNLGSGGAPFSPELQRKLKEHFPNSRETMGTGYGLSESVTAVTVNFGEELNERPTSAGRLVPTHEIEIRDEQGRALPDGAQGEICIRSPYLMLEYWRNPEATAEAIRPGRWLHTGDFGRFEDGFLYIDARARDLILRAAENIYPVEIEQRLEAHPSVAEVAVLGVDHPTLGQEVKAIVVPAPGTTPDFADLAAFAAEKLAAFKIPAHWEVRSDPLPRNASGKVLKTVLEGVAENTFLEE